jgi:hypothetical protein
VPNGAGLDPELAGNHAVRFGRHEMRHAMFAIAALFMTLTAFSGTVAIMVGNTGPGVEIA